MNESEDVAVIDNQVKARRWSGLGLFLALVLALGAFYSGLQVQAVLAMVNGQTAGLWSFWSSAPVKAPPTEVDLSQFWEVWDLLDKRFIPASSSQPITTEDKINGAIAGLVSAYGDPYTVFLPPEDSAAFAEDISGNFSGVGMEVGLRDGVITIIAPLPDTPAFRAGLLAGDYIVKIDDESTEGMRIDEAVRKIRGERGTSVKLSIFREGELEPKDYIVTRDTINIPTVKTERVNDVFIIRLYSFNALAETKMQAALNEYQRSGLNKLILDLRGNPGGYLQSAVTIAGHFLPAGKVVVRERSGDGSEDKLYRSQGRKVLDQTPDKFVVLLDNGSASASEILAGALREHGVATIVGVSSFGKGSVQELIPVKGASSLKVTVARWLTPNGLSISDGGLKPDIVINRTPQQRLAGEDPQNDAALRFLGGEKVDSE